jgi:GTP-binding protein HflX
MIALVGYTNAGKSTLFNALTDAGVVASPRMFATLDPTVRSIVLPSKRKVLLSDTVGFIRNLPTTLVSAFRATLEEVQRAALLLHVSDVSSPIAHEQQRQVEDVLDELGVTSTPRVRVMNKIDLLPETQRRSLIDGAETVYVSAAQRLGMERLLAAIDERVQIDSIQRLTVRIPQSEGKLLAQIEARARILARAYRDSAVQMEVEAPESLARSLQRFVVSEKSSRVKAKKTYKNLAQFLTESRWPDRT